MLWKGYKAVFSKSVMGKFSYLGCRHGGKETTDSKLNKFYGDNLLI